MSELPHPELARRLARLLGKGYAIVGGEGALRVPGRDERGATVLASAAGSPPGEGEDDDRRADE